MRCGRAGACSASGRVRLVADEANTEMNCASVAGRRGWKRDFVAKRYFTPRVLHPLGERNRVHPGQRDADGAAPRDGMDAARSVRRSPVRPVLRRRLSPPCGRVSEASRARSGQPTWAASTPRTGSLLVGSTRSSTAREAAYPIGRTATREQRQFVDRRHFATASKEWCSRGAAIPDG
jgi:hypothetical protein